MPKKRDPYIETFLTRHGKRIWYFRVGQGKRTRLPDTYGSPEFREAYRSALAQHVSGERENGRTMAWLVDQYKASPAWANAANETKKQFRVHQDWNLASFPSKSRGAFPKPPIFACLKPLLEHFPIPNQWRLKNG